MLKIKDDVDLIILYVEDVDIKGYVYLKDVLIETFAEIEKLYNQKGYVTGVPTGFADLDLKTNGLHDSDLLIVAARPAIGKSAFAINIASNVALQSGKGVAIFNLEMSKDQVGNRILCSEAMIDSYALRTGKLDNKNWQDLRKEYSDIVGEFVSEYAS